MLTSLEPRPEPLKGPAPPRQRYDLLFVIMELTRERFSYYRRRRSLIACELNLEAEAPADRAA